MGLVDMADDDVAIRVVQCPVYDVCADDTFDSPIANLRLGYRMPEAFEERIRRPLGVAAAIGAYMAGRQCPTPERVTELVHDVSDIQDWERSAIHELFAQLSPAECVEFTVTTDGSPREVARLMRECGVRRGLVVNWINQYSSDPDWREDEMLAIQYGELWVKIYDVIVPRREAAGIVANVEAARARRRA